jgi:hypothetical protein
MHETQGEQAYLGRIGALVLAVAKPLELERYRRDILKCPEHLPLAVPSATP